MGSLCFNAAYRIYKNMLCVFLWHFRICICLIKVKDKYFSRPYNTMQCTPCNITAPPTQVGSNESEGGTVKAVGDIPVVVNICFFFLYNLYLLSCDSGINLYIICLYSIIKKVPNLVQKELRLARNTKLNFNVLDHLAIDIFFC